MKEKMTKSEKSKKRKELINNSAKKLFLKNGYRFTSVDQIADEAGYSKRTVYLDYKNKDDLFLKTATDGLDLLIKKLEVIPDSNDLRQYIIKYLQTIVTFSTEQSDYFKILITDVTSDIIVKASDEQKKRAALLEKTGTELLANQIKNGIKNKRIKKADPWETAEIIIGSAVGIIQLSQGGSQTILSKKKLASKVQKMGEYIYQGLM